MSTTPNKAESTARMACPVHGEQPWLAIAIDDDHQFFCLVCVREMLTRMGVRGMFPVPVLEPVEQWPEEVEV